MTNYVSGECPGKVNKSAWCTGMTDCVSGECL